LKNFDNWNDIKKKISKEKKPRSFQEMDIFNVKIGKNVGFEQNGVGNQFVRPVIILKKFNQHFFFAVPLSTTTKKSPYNFEFEFIENKPSVALLSQLRNMDAKRLLNKIGKIKKDDFQELKKRIQEIID
jgi:mRNA-degrading endonuclease toxin of MazEF toxin-antitoxin module